MDKQFLMTAFERMCRIRKFDMWMHENRKKPDSPLMGLMHSQIGEEAYSAAVICQLRDDDYLSTTYRNHAHSIARNISMKSLAAEVCGKKEGCCHGRAGNMHAIDQNLNIIAGFGIIGAGLPATVGTALASQYKGTDQISVAFFGDGAVPQGAFHESMNLAKRFNLPVLFVNNNNHYAMSTPAENNIVDGSSISYPDAYKMEKDSADGMDFFAAYEAAKKGIEYVRSGKGPYFIEFDCYRYHGQWEGDEQAYKPEEQVKAYWDRDPIKQFRKKAIEKGLLTSDELDTIENDVEKQIDNAFEYAKGCNMPTEEDIMTDIYASKY